MEKDTIRFQLQHSLCKRQTILTFSIPKLLKIAKPRWIWKWGGGRLSTPPLHLKKHMKVIWLPFPWRPMGVSSIPSHTKKEGKEQDLMTDSTCWGGRAELRGRGMSRYIKRFGDPKEKTRPIVSHYTGRRRWRMQEEEFLCTPDKIFLFVIFPAMHVGMEDRNTKTWMESLLCCCWSYACSTRWNRMSVFCLERVGGGDGISCVSSMYAFCKY